MSLSSLITWEVRTTGNDAQCSGGFKSGATGTDYSQQNAAQFSGSNLVVDASVNTKVTSASHNFVAADVGNLIQITAGSGWTTGFYEIVSVASNAATLDRSPAATSTTGGTWWEGGAMGTPGKVAGVKVAGNDVWIKAGTYVFTTSTANVSGGVVNDNTGGNNGTDISRWEGYGSVRGDKGTKPVLQAPSSGSFGVYLVTATTSFTVADNLCVDGGGNTTAGLGGWDVGGGSYIAGIRLKAMRTVTYGFRSSGGNDSQLVFCEATGCSAAGFRNDGTTSLIYCISHGNTGGSGHGFMYSANDVLVGCIAYGNDYGFVSLSVGARFINCDAFGNTHDGWNIQSVQGEFFLNCISYSNGGYGWNAIGGVVALGTLINCAGGSNTSGNYTGFQAVENFVILTGDPFTSSGTGDFSLNNTAGAGATCRAAGQPGVFPGGITTGYVDIGAAQHQDVGGGGGSTMKAFVG